MTQKQGRTLLSLKAKSGVGRFVRQCGSITTDCLWVWLGPERPQQLSAAVAFQFRLVAASKPFPLKDPSW